MGETVEVAVKVEVRPWVWRVFAVAQRLPWALRWIGADRLAGVLVRFGVRVHRA